MKNKICFIVNVEYVVNHFLINHLAALSKIYEVTLVGNFNRLPKLEEKGIDVNIHRIPFRRGMNLLCDIFAFGMLFIFLINNKFDVIHSITPKMGFFTSIIGFILGFKKRIHTFTGQVWAFKKGIRAFFFKYADKVSATQRKRSGFKLFAGGGIIGLIVILGLVSLLWSNRKKESTKKDIFSRQMKGKGSVES